MCRSTYLTHMYSAYSAEDVPSWRQGFGLWASDRDKYGRAMPNRIAATAGPQISADMRMIDLTKGVKWLQNSPPVENIVDLLLIHLNVSSYHCRHRRY
jgi:hypothetical protein